MHNVKQEVKTIICHSNRETRTGNFDHIRIVERGKEYNRKSEPFNFLPIKLWLVKVVTICF